MKITNQLNLPAPLVRAIQADPYNKGDCDYSVTTLIKPPRIVELERRHDNELEEDAADRIFALMGQIGHLVLERGGAGELTEKRFYATRLGKKIGGQLDLWANNTILDYKLTSIWAAKDGLKPEWECQLNLLALLARENGIEVTAAQIVALYRDWSIGSARREQDYPQRQCQVFPVPLWPAEKQESYLADRISRHLRAVIELPLCTPLERWARPEKWAVMKEGNKRALKLYDTEAEALNMHQIGYKPKLYVEHRPGVQTRCLDYCPVSAHCSWWQEYQKTHPEG